MHRSRFLLCRFCVLKHPEFQNWGQLTYSLKNKGAENSSFERSHKRHFPQRDFQREVYKWKVWAFILELNIKVKNHLWLFITVSKKRNGYVIWSGVITRGHTGEGDGVRGAMLYSFLDGEGELDGDADSDLSLPERTEEGEVSEKSIICYF